MIIARSVSKLLWNVRQNTGCCARLCNLVAECLHEKQHFIFLQLKVGPVANSAKWPDANGFLVDDSDLMDLYFSMQMQKLRELQMVRAKWDTSTSTSSQGGQSGSWVNDVNLYSLYSVAFQDTVKFQHNFTMGLA